MLMKTLSGILALGLIMAMVGCNTTPVQDGAVVGGALGAASGAIIGHQSGRQGEGALIGAGLGALTGAIVGDQVQQNRQQRPVVTQKSTANPPQRYRKEIRLIQAPSGEVYEQEVLVPY